MADKDEKVAKDAQEHQEDAPRDPSPTAGEEAKPQSSEQSGRGACWHQDIRRTLASVH